MLALAVVSTQVRLDWLGPAIAAVTRRDPDLDGIDWTSLRAELAARGLLGAAGPGRRRATTGATGEKSPTRSAPR